MPIFAVATIPLPPVTSGQGASAVTLGEDGAAVLLVQERDGVSTGFVGVVAGVAVGVRVDALTVGVSPAVFPASPVVFAVRTGEEEGALFRACATIRVLLGLVPGTLASASAPSVALGVAEASLDSAVGVGGCVAVGFAVGIGVAVAVAVGATVGKGGLVGVFVAVALAVGVFTVVAVAVGGFTVVAVMGIEVAVGGLVGVFVAMWVGVSIAGVAASAGAFSKHA
jgi:hypothetical protein